MGKEQSPDLNVPGDWKVISEECHFEQLCKRLGGSRLGTTQFEGRNVTYVSEQPLKPGEKRGMAMAAEVCPFFAFRYRNGNPYDLEIYNLAYGNKENPTSIPAPEKTSEAKNPTGQ